jgi:hypothetical protein
MGLWLKVMQRVLDPGLALRFSRDDNFRATLLKRNNQILSNL